MSPRDWNFPNWEKDTIRWENLTPEELTKKVHEVTGANENYIRSLIAKENNIVAGNFCGSVVASINFTCSGGSSSVFNSALKAPVESICTSSMI